MFLALALKVVCVICSLFCTTQYFQELCFTKNTNSFFSSLAVFQSGQALYEFSSCATRLQAFLKVHMLFWSRIKMDVTSHKSPFHLRFKILTVDRGYENRYYLSCDGILSGLIDFTVRIHIASGWMNTEHSQLLRSIHGLWQRSAALVNGAGNSIVNNQPPRLSTSQKPMF